MTAFSLISHCFLMLHSSHGSMCVSKIVFQSLPVTSSCVHKRLNVLKSTLDKWKQEGEIHKDQSEVFSLLPSHCWSWRKYIEGPILAIFPAPILRLQWSHEIKGTNISLRWGGLLPCSLTPGCSRLPRVAVLVLESWLGLSPQCLLNGFL